MLCFVTLGIEPRALQMLRKRSITELHHSCYKKFNRRSTYEHHTQISKCDTKLKKIIYKGTAARMNSKNIFKPPKKLPTPSTLPKDNKGKKKKKTKTCQPGSVGCTERV